MQRGHRVLSLAQHLALATLYHKVGVPTELRPIRENVHLSLAVSNHAQVQ